jgi:hypothetical protein
MAAVVPRTQDGRAALAAARRCATRLRERLQAPALVLEAIAGSEDRPAGFDAEVARAYLALLEAAADLDRLDAALAQIRLPQSP